MCCYFAGLLRKESCIGVVIRYVLTSNILLEVIETFMCVHVCVCVSNGEIHSVFRIIIQG